LELWYFGNIVKKAKEANKVVNRTSGSSYFVSASNAGSVSVISASETVATTKDIAFASRSKVIIDFSCKIAVTGGVANLTAKTYVDGTALTYQPVLYCAGANTYVLSYHDIKGGIASGTKTIAVKLQTDANGGSIYVSQAVMTVQVYIDATPGLYDPQGFTLTVIDDDEIDAAWANPSGAYFSEVELYRDTLSKNERWKRKCININSMNH